MLSRLADLRCLHCCVLTHVRSLATFSGDACSVHANKNERRPCTYHAIQADVQGALPLAEGTEVTRVSSPTDITDHLTDLTNPASWYPAARMMRRKVVAHMGPTNSGKTHAALQALKAADTGVYCGPLRLLAWEISEKLNADDVPCSLITGQERRVVAEAKHAACTVEMASVSRQVDVAVVDEIQMVADSSRGHSFTRAILGIPAHTLHVCGDPAALSLLRQLVQDAGDTLEVLQYERLLPLKAEKAALGTLEGVRKGDCLVAFSRREVHSTKRALESWGALKCCVVYGALPAESRTQQAILFNKPRTGFNVMSASDAVGMGLNLNIRRIVFTSLEKFDGACYRPLTATEVQQIAGRAGRFGSSHCSGRVTCMHQEDMPYLHTALASASPELQQACLFPSYQQLAVFAEQHQHLDLSDALELFADRATLSQHFFFSNYEPMHKLALMLRHLDLSLRKHYIFALSPTDPEDPPVAAALLSFASCYASRGHVDVTKAQRWQIKPARTESDLEQLEAAYRILDLYIWLSFRREEAEKQRKLVAALIEEALPRLALNSRALTARQKRQEKMDLIDASRAIEDHFNGSQWDRRIQQKLVTPVYQEALPSGDVPRLLKRSRKHHREWELQ